MRLVRRMIQRFSSGDRKSCESTGWFRSFRSGLTPEFCSCSLARRYALTSKLQNAIIKLNTPWDEWFYVQFRSLSPWESLPPLWPFDDEPEDDEDNDETWPDEPDDKLDTEWAEPEDKLESEPEIVFWSPPKDEPNECPSELCWFNKNKFNWLSLWGGETKLTCARRHIRNLVWLGELSEQAGFRHSKLRHHLKQLTEGWNNLVLNILESFFDLLNF